MTSDLCEVNKLHFWEAFITYYHHAKFQDSGIKHREKILSFHVWARVCACVCFDELAKHGESMY